MQFVLEILLIIIASGTPLYFFFNFGAFSFFGMCAALACFLYIRCLYGHQLVRAMRKNSILLHQWMPERGTGIAIIFLAACVLSLLILGASGITRSITGPWEAVQPIFFTVYFLQSLLLVATIMAGIPRPFALAGITLHSLVSLAVIPLVYPLGFGFDPVIHGQAEQIIANTGSLAPKTLYYTGQYVLLVFLSKISFLPLATLDRLLLPLVAAASIPLFAMRALSALACSPRFCALGALFSSLALLPTISSPTPWGWSAFLFFIFVFASIEFFALPDKGGLMFLMVLAMATLFIHPIAGLPLAAALLLLLLIRHTAIPKAGIAGIVILGGLSVPLAFLANASGSARIGWNPLVFARFPDFLPWRFSALFDPLHTLAALLPFLLMVFWFLGVKKTFSLRSKAAILSVGISGMTLVGYVVMRFFLEFPFLIDYEQSSYADRFLTLLLFSSVPIVLVGARPFLERLFSGPALVRTAGVFFLAGGLAGGLYLSYPKNDPYESSHAYNISSADIAAVRAIHDDAKSKPYSVLANQVASAAAIKEYGFAVRYPVPTSSPLYQLYLSFLNTRSRESINAALKTTGAENVYVIIHDYEPHSRTIASAASTLADPSFEFERDGIWVYRFSKTEANDSQ